MVIKSILLVVSFAVVVVQDLKTLSSNIHCSSKFKKVNCLEMFFVELMNLLKVTI